MNPAINHLKDRFGEYLEDLKTLVRIPSVSFRGFPESEVQKSAEAVAALLRKRGLEHVQVLTIPGAHPYVYGDWLHAVDAPTVILYAHHDVQPPGREELWTTPPFEPTLKSGPGGARLYGRGTADDKAGIVVHTSAIDATLKAFGRLPVNVKVVVEGEEETASHHLPEFLTTYKDLLKADVVVLTDSGNFDSGVPALTIALRGLVGLQVEVRALSKSIHSGLWGGPIPDPVMGLVKMLAGMTDENGRIAIPGLLDKVRPISDQEMASLQQIPFDEAEFRRQSGMIPTAKILAEGPSPGVQIWRLPSLAISAIQASSRKQAGNIINDSAWCFITVRLVADMDPNEVVVGLESFLQQRLPWGLEVKFQRDAVYGPWMANATGPAFDAVEASLLKGYGKAPFKIGCGASIPFVKPFTHALEGAPALLVGIEDPYSDAHAENESLLISDLEKSAASEIYLFEELATRLRRT